MESINATRRFRIARCRRPERVRLAIGDNQAAPWRRDGPALFVPQKPVVSKSPRPRQVRDRVGGEQMCQDRQKQAATRRLHPGGAERRLLPSNAVGLVEIGELFERAAARVQIHCLYVPVGRPAPAPRPAAVLIWVSVRRSTARARALGSLGQENLADFCSCRRVSLKV